jgi:hypothetical protein
MYIIISKIPDTNGRYSWSTTDDDAIVDIVNHQTSAIADESYLSVLNEYDGFVDIEFGDTEVLHITPNQQAYGAYNDKIAVEPEPESDPPPSPSVWDELDAAYQEGVNDV